MNAANRATPAFLADAGIALGMRVLDLGCAFGELTRLVARMVGPNGAVTGIDRNRAYLAQARGTEAEPGAAPVHYGEADLTGDLSGLAERFDAIVIRRVLMYLPDPEGLIARLPALLRPGGLLAVQEHDATGLPISAASLPLHREAHRWVWDTVVAEGGRRTMGMTLPGMLEAAGWTVASWRAEATLIGARETSWLGHAVRGMLPRMVAGKVVADGEVDLETLDARLEAERREADSALVWDMAHMIAARAPA